MCDIRYWMWLSLILYPGSGVADQLLPAFDYDAQNIYMAEEDDYRKIPNLDDKAIYALLDKDLTKADEVLEYCEANNIGILTFDNPHFPARLRRIERVPYLLYYRGNLIDIDNSVAVAAVGTRSCSEYGRREGYKICRDLAIGGALIISGMARGIDSVCHQAALDVGARTVAVLGCGINKVYPPENELLMDEILENGMVISEYKPFTDPIGSNFPVRNRIISGMSLGTLVVEADIRSGAMITARYAVKQGRDIFAVPGKVGDSRSLGTNELIQNGAKMVQSGVDVLEEYEFFFPNQIAIDRLPRFSKFSLNPLRKIRAQKAAENKTESTKESISKKQETPQGKPEKKNVPPAEVDKRGSAPEENYDKYKLSPETVEILKAMPLGCGISPDELSKNNFSTQALNSSMTILEIKGLVKRIPGGKFVRLK